MKKRRKILIAFIFCLAMFMMSSIPAFAADLTSENVTNPSAAQSVDNEVKPIETQLITADEKTSPDVDNTDRSIRVIPLVDPLKTTGNAAIIPVAAVKPAVDAIGVPIAATATAALLPGDVVGQTTGTALGSLIGFPGNEIG